MTLLRDLIDIPTSVGEGDFVVRAAEGADLDSYVVTDQLRDSFGQALRRIGHALGTGRSQAMFLHGSFGSGKSHFMVVLREILRHNPQAREIRGLAEPVITADPWLPGKRIFTLTCHMLDAQSVEQAVLEGYLRQVTALHPDAPVPAVHRSDALLRDAAGIRRRMGDDEFFAALREGPVPIRLREDLTPAGWRPLLADAGERLCLPEVSEKALTGLKFSAALPKRLAIATLAARLADVDGAAVVVREPSRFVSLTG